MKLNFSEDVQIDTDDIGVECLRQATLYQKYKQHEVEKKRELDEAWEEVKTVRSELIRSTAENEEIKKLIKNAQQAEAYYRTHPDYKAAKQAHIEAEYEYSMACAATSGIYQRKGTLENLVKLMVMDYYARPAEPKDLAEEYDKVKEREERTEEVRTKAAKRMRRKK